VELPTYDEAELKKLVTVDLNCQSLEEYLRGFDITLKVLQRSYAITRAVYEVRVFFLFFSMELIDGECRS
jgi:adenosine deaminase